MLNSESRKKPKYRAAIIGAGRIGASFDTPDTKDVLTHAHAYSLHDGVDLVGICDIDKAKAELAASLWSTDHFSTIEQLIGEAKPEIVSVCTPDETHIKILEKLIDLGTKVIICEKPVSADINETARLMARAKKAGVAIAVNYSRRYDETLAALQADFKSGKYGKILAAYGLYTRGTLHNASHLIDTMRYLCGEVTSALPFFSVDDFSGADVSVGAFLQFESCPQFNLIVGDGRHYFIFELDILFEKVRVRFTNKGFSKTVEQIAVDEHFPDFIRSPKEGDREPTKLGRACLRLVDNVVAYLDGREKLLCDVEEAYKTESVCAKLLINRKENV